MVKEGFKVELQPCRGLAGGLLRLTGPALILWPLVVGTAGKARAWMRLRALEVSREFQPPPPPPLLPVKLNRARRNKGQGNLRDEETIFNEVDCT